MSFDMLIAQGAPTSLDAYGLFLVFVENNRKLASGKLLSHYFGSFS